MITVLFGVILFSCSVTRASAFLLGAVNFWLALIFCDVALVLCASSFVQKSCSVDSAHVVSFTVCRLIVRCGLDE